MMNNKSEKVLTYKGYKGSVHHEEEFYYWGNVDGLDPERYVFEGSCLIDLEKDFHETVDNYLESCKDKGIKPII